MSALSPLAALLGGALTLLAPCSVLVLPAFFSYAFQSARALLGRTALFWLGLLLVLVPLGTLAGAIVLVATLLFARDPQAAMPHRA